MKNVLIIIQLFLVSNLVFGQISFVTKFGNNGYDYARDVKEDVDTGYVITGGSSSFGTESSDAYILKADSLGNFVWSYPYGGDGTEWGEEIVVTIDSTYAIAGYSNSQSSDALGGFDMYVVKADRNGVPIWEKRYGGTDWDKAFCLTEMPDSGFVIVGETYSFNGTQQGFVVRINKQGDTLWTFKDPSLNPTFFTSIDRDNDSLVICGGIGDGGVDTYDGYVIKMDLNGNVSWSKVEGMQYNDYFTTVDIVDTVYSFGGIRSFNYANDLQDIWIYRLVNDGTIISNITYPDPTFEHDAIHDIAVLPINQDLYYVGETRSYGYVVDGKSDIFIAKESLTEYFLSATTIGWDGDDIAYGIDICRDGGVVLCGDTYLNSTGGGNCFIMKVGPSWTFPLWIVQAQHDSITTSIYSINEKSDLVLYPNPATSELSIFGAESGIISFYDNSGKLVYEENYQNGNISLESLSSGLYYVILNIDGSFYRKKLVVR